MEFPERLQTKEDITDAHMSDSDLGASSTDKFLVAVFTLGLENSGLR